MFFVCPSTYSTPVTWLSREPVKEVGVETNDTIVPSRRKGFHEMGADEAGAAGDEDGRLRAYVQIG